MREATSSDLPSLIRLARQASEELGGMRGGEIWRVREARPEPLDETLQRAVEDPDVLVLVGTIDGYPVGFTVVAIEELRDGTTIGVIEDLFVEPQARGVSVGAVMMDAVLAWCRDRGCRGVDSLVLPGHREAKNFFERFGLTGRAILVHRSLG